MLGAVRGALRCVQRCLLTPQGQCLVQQSWVTDNRLQWCRQTDNNGFLTLGILWAPFLLETPRWWKAFVCAVLL